MDNTHAFNVGGRKLPIESINYDFVPTGMPRQKVLYVTVKFPPQGLRIGDFVRIVGADIPFVPFQVSDIVGQRIVLNSNIVPSIFYTYTGSPRYYGPRHSLWGAENHGGQWGYTTRNYDVLPDIGRDWHYGRGSSMAYLQY
jgi:hypothetical protein